MFQHLSHFPLYSALSDVLTSEYNLRFSCICGLGLNGLHWKAIPFICFVYLFFLFCIYVFICCSELHVGNVKPEWSRLIFSPVLGQLSALLCLYVLSDSLSLPISHSAAPSPRLWEPFVMQVHEIKWVFVSPKLTPSHPSVACLPAIPWWA